MPGDQLAYGKIKAMVVAGAYTSNSSEQTPVGCAWELILRQYRFNECVDPAAKQELLDDDEIDLEHGRADALATFLDLYPLVGPLSTTDFHGVAAQIYPHLVGTTIVDGLFAVHFGDVRCFDSALRDLIVEFMMQTPGKMKTSLAHLINSNRK